MTGLTTVEKKLLGALLIMANDDMVAHCTTDEMAEKMGWNTGGGIITYALRTLEAKNFVAKIAPRTYKVMV